MSRRCVPATALAVPLSPRGHPIFAISSRIVARLHQTLNPPRKTARATLLFFVILTLVFSFSSAANAQTSRVSNPASRPRVVELRIGDEIEPIMAEYVDGVIAQAGQQHASLVLITMDTPGGLGTSMED